MTRHVLATLTFVGLAACGTATPDHVKTSDEWLAEQDAEGAKAQKDKKQNEGAYDDPAGSTEDEKKREWDDKQVDLELRRAARSAETCPESVTEKAPKGRATVTMIFMNDGHVKEAKITDTYADNAVGKCVLRAMNSVIVPAYTGGDHTIEWEIDLTGAKKSGPVNEKKEE